MENFEHAPKATETPVQKPDLFEAEEKKEKTPEENLKTIIFKNPNHAEHQKMCYEVVEKIQGRKVNINDFNDVRTAIIKDIKSYLAKEGKKIPNGTKIEIGLYIDEIMIPPLEDHQAFAFDLTVEKTEDWEVNLNSQIVSR